jgi:predicted nucleic acid-binding protein
MPIIEFPFKVVPDTSVLIPFINQGISHPGIETTRQSPLFYMSAVVFEELYAGAVDAATIKLLDKMYDTFDKLGRLIVPSASDWQKAGKLLAKMGKKYGFEMKFRARIQNDVLIALDARSIGASVITNNIHDFRKIREFLDFKLFEIKEN